MKILTTVLVAAMALTPVAGVAGPKGCPPGLAKKNNGCLPPGQAKKIEQRRDDRQRQARQERDDREWDDRQRDEYDWEGRRVDDGWRRVDPDTYGLPPAPAGEDYYTDGDRIVRVMRDTLEIVAFVALVAVVSRWVKQQQDAAAGRVIVEE